MAPLLTPIAMVSHYSLPPLAAHGVFVATANLFYIAPQALALASATMAGSSLGDPLSPALSIPPSKLTLPLEAPSLGDPPIFYLIVYTL